MGARFPGRILPYILLAPSVIIVAVFLVIPSVQSLYLSFFRTSPFGDRLIYTRFDNFIRLFESPDYIDSLLRTLFFSGFIIVVGISLSLLLAVLANQKISGVGLYRTALIWPYTFSPAVAGTIWALLWDPATGAMPYFWSLFGGGRINWMLDGTLALIVVSAAATWKMLGYNIMIFLAGLQSVPRDVMEASELDGAGAFRRFFQVVFPFITPSLFFLVIMNSLYAFFDTFGLIDIMTHGGPGGATEVLVYKLYRNGFISLRTGYASAQSIILFVFVALFTVLQFRIGSRRVFYQ